MENRIEALTLVGDDMTYVTTWLGGPECCWTIWAAQNWKKEKIKWAHFFFLQNMTGMALRDSEK